MFERVYGPAQSAGWLSSGSTLVSVGVHLAALAVVGAFAGAGASQLAETLAEGIVFLAPPPTSAAGPQPASEQLTYTDLRGSGGDGVDAGSLAGADTPLVGEGLAEGDRTSGEAEVPEAQSLLSVFEVDADSVYLASQVDNPVAYDARSAAPAYPDSLRRAGVEGQVTAQFVVDSTGRIDVGSFVLLESSHGRFTESVRQALPGMYFRPAELNGRRIRQLVQLPFVFKIEPGDSTVARKGDGTSG